MMALREPKHVGAAFIILTILIMQRFKIHVHYLDNKVFDIIDARYNHEVQHSNVIQ